MKQNRKENIFYDSTHKCKEKSWIWNHSLFIDNSTENEWISAQWNQSFCINIISMWFIHSYRFTLDTSMAYNIFFILKANLPLARGFVSNFWTMLSYAISSATPESFTNFSLTAIQISCFAKRSSNSSNACTCNGKGCYNSFFSFI